MLPDEWPLSSAQATFTHCPSLCFLSPVAGRLLVHRLENNVLYIVNHNFDWEGNGLFTHYTADHKFTRRGPSANGKRRHLRNTDKSKSDAESSLIATMTPIRQWESTEQHYCITATVGRLQKRTIFKALPRGTARASRADRDCFTWEWAACRATRPVGNVNSKNKPMRRTIGA